MGIKLDIEGRGWPVYDEQSQTGGLRHMSLRVGPRTGEILLTLVASGAHLKEQLYGLREQAKEWLTVHPGLVGVCVNKHGNNTRAIFGPETVCVAGRGYLFEEFAGLKFRVGPTTFFQVNSEQAEAMIHVILEGLKLRGHETLVDAYCGIGTLTLPLAQKVPQGEVLGMDTQREAIEAARANASSNKICNAKFEVCDAKSIVATLANKKLSAGVVILDPPGKGIQNDVVEALLNLRPKKIVYVSCNASTLARDLEKLCSGKRKTYDLKHVQPLDFFPQTSHVETVAFLEIAR